MLEIRDNKVEFDIFKMARTTSLMKSCFRVDTIEDCVQETFKKQLTQDPLEACLVHDAKEDDVD